MTDWRATPAALILADMEAGRRPATIWKLRRLARRYGARLVISRDRRCPEGLALPGLVLVRWTADRALLRRRIVHELAEAALRWEGLPPYRFAGDSQDLHRVASLVERAEKA